MKKQKMSKEAKEMIKKVGEQIHDQFNSQEGEEEMNEATENNTMMKGANNMKNMRKVALAMVAVAAVTATAYGIYKVVKGEKTVTGILDTDWNDDAEGADITVE